MNDDLADRIRAAVQELNYQPNIGARSLVMRAPAEVAFVCPDVRNSFFGEMFHGLSDSLSDKFRVNLIVGSDIHDYDSTAVTRAQSGDIAGLVLANPSAQVLTAIRETCPTVYVDVTDTTPDRVTINIDLESAGVLVADHLVALGHRRIGYLDLQLDKDTYATRYRALSDALLQRGAAVVSKVASRDLTIEAAAEAFETVWPEWGVAGVTAVVCAQDMIALGVIDAAKRLRIDVPRRVSLCAFDDLPVANLIDPSLTTVHLDPTMLGAKAGEALLQLLDGRPTSSATLPVRLMERRSTARATPGLGS